MAEDTAESARLPLREQKGSMLMKIARIAPLTYTPGMLEYFQFIRGGIGADYHL